uniref:MYM-type domain-containing protein n=1 Tax=viral metagenome TaxID=1070528 RepID=A0A6C0KYA2_9ZZZZ
MTDVLPIKPKRGRRSKKDIEAANAQIKSLNNMININQIENKVEGHVEGQMEGQLEGQMEGQMEGQEDINIAIKIEEKEEENENENEQVEDNVIVKQGAKKRGRKPKGGKIIIQNVPTNIQKETRQNVILHLKCSIKDLELNGDYNSNFINANIESFNFSSAKNELCYEIINNDSNTKNNEQYVVNEEKSDDESQPNVCDKKELWRKLKSLEQSLHLNNISDKKSACFWCSYDFDNPPIHIPKHFIKNSYSVYGCFCTPECAVAYLMEESIDSSTKFERYSLMNHIYSKIYEYKKNIKPAPNPHYMLERFYGPLTIQEYRSLLKTERLFLIVDKPLTRILPEFHEDNDDFIINHKIIPSNNYQMKKIRDKKPQTKTNIMNEKFGLVTN